MKAAKHLTLITISLFWFLSCSNLQVEVPHAAEKIHFNSGKFNVYGELRIPKHGMTYPLVIMVHGSGPARMTYYSKIKESFLKAGYATLMWDKPGYGKSTGEFSKDHLRAERAGILIDAIREMKKHPKIIAEKIGVWGISQAGYVIPMALEKTDGIKFQILVSVGGENGVRQTAYFVREQLLCEGMPEQEARLAGKNFIGLVYATNYNDYLRCAKPLVENPQIKKLGVASAIWSKDEWKPHEKSDEDFYDPIIVVEKTTIPTLVFFGDLDKNVNPIQGMEAYKAALKKAGNPNYKVELIGGTDHNIIISKSGCEKERRMRSASGWSDYDPRYLRMMEQWLKEL